MRLAPYRGDKTLAALVTRLFPGASDPAAIEKTLLRTNPHLRNLGAAQSGAPIVLTDDLPASADAVAIDRCSTVESRIKPANESLRGAVTAPATSTAGAAVVPAISPAAAATVLASPPASPAKTAATKAPPKTRKARKPKPRK